MEGHYSHVFSQETLRAIAKALGWEYDFSTDTFMGNLRAIHTMSMIQGPDDIKGTYLPIEDPYRLDISFSKPLTHEELCQRTDILLLDLPARVPHSSTKSRGQFTLKLTYV